MGELFLKFAELARNIRMPEEKIIEWAEEQVKKEEDKIEKKRVEDEEREERKLKREIDQKRVEQEEERRRLEAQTELKKIEAEEAEKKRKHEAEEEEKKRKHEIEMRNLGHRPESSQNTNRSSGNKPKLPTFNEKVDQIDGFIHRFEMHATAVGWDKSTWCSALANLLTGKALEVFTSMKVENAGNYDILKESLLKRFEFTEDGFSKRFRACKPEEGENFTSFINRLKHYLDRWTELAGVKDKSFDQLYDLMLRDQVYSACHHDLVAHLKERKPANCDELTKTAELYATAHPSKPLAKSRRDEPCYASVGMGSQSYSSGPRRSFDRYGAKDRFRSHDPQNRYNRNYDLQNSRGQRFRHDDAIDQNNKPKTDKSHLTCYNCRGKGHVKSECLKPGGGAFRKSGPNSQASNSTPDKLVKRRGGYNASSCLVDLENKPEENTQTLSNETSAAMRDDSQTKQGQNTPVATTTVSSSKLMSHQNGSLEFEIGVLNGRQCSLLRDSGSNTVGVRKSLIDEKSLTGESVKCVLFGGTIEKFPLARVHISTPYYVGEVIACVLPDPVADIIIGNIKGIKDHKTHSFNDDCDPENDELNYAGAAVTRAQSKEVSQDRLIVVTSSFDVTPETFVKEQESCPTLKPCFEKARKGEKGKTYYTIENSVLYRTFDNGKKMFKQVMVPQKFRNDILKLGHDASTAAHQGKTRTKKKILSKFFWPGIYSDIHSYIRTCDVCQKRSPKGRCSVAALQEMPLVYTPFEMVGIDIVGPLEKSDRNCRYLLTLVDYATRWPEAIPLKDTTTEHVAEALMSIFARLGIPKTVLSDRGSQFVSDVMKETMKLMGIEQRFTTPYHPETNGLTERVNGVIKNLLKKVAAEKPSQWDRFVPAVLFAYREIPQETTGFSPFELLYGREPRGPMAVLQELFIGSDATEEVRSAYRYVVDLSERIKESCKLAQEAVQDTRDKYTEDVSQNTNMRTLEPGDKALLLLPKDKNKLLLTWQGPFEVVRKVSRVNYEIKVKGKKKVFHINMLKKYESRETLEQTSNTCVFTLANSATIVDAEDDDGEEPEPSIPIPSWKPKETFKDVKVCEDLTEVQKKQVFEVLKEYSDVLTDRPGKTTLLEHEIKLTTQEPVRVKPYPIPFQGEQVIIDEVKTMLDLGVIEPSTSPYCSPIVLVKKPDGTNRFCIDFRKLNSVTVFDAEPIPIPEELMTKLGDAVLWKNRPF